MTAPSSKKLARALDKAGYAALAERARGDEFHDFLSASATPVLDLYRAVSDMPQSPARDAILARIRNGDFDATMEESEAWAHSEEGRATMERMVGEMVSQPIEGHDAPTPHRDLAMKYLARVVEAVLPGEGFCLLSFDFGPDARSDYISNASREQMAAAMLEHALNMSGRMEFEDRCNMLQAVGDGVFKHDRMCAVLVDGASDMSSIISNQPRSITASVFEQAGHAVTRRGAH